MPNSLNGTDFRTCGMKEEHDVHVSHYLLEHVTYRKGVDASDFAAQ